MRRFARCGSWSKLMRRWKPIRNVTRNTKIITKAFSQNSITGANVFRNSTSKCAARRMCTGKRKDELQPNCLEAQILHLAIVSRNYAHKTSARVQGHRERSLQINPGASEPH